MFALLCITYKSDVFHKFHKCVRTGFMCCKLKFYYRKCWNCLMFLQGVAVWANFPENVWDIKEVRCVKIGKDNTKKSIW